MDTPSFVDFDTSNPDKLIFDIKNADVSFVNSLRRTIITDVKTIGFNTDDYENSDLKVIENTSSLHNEFMLHRIGLVPVYSDNIETYDTNNNK